MEKWLLDVGLRVTSSGRDIIDAINKFEKLSAQEQADAIEAAAKKLCKDIRAGKERLRME